MKATGTWFPYDAHQEQFGGRTRAPQLVGSPRAQHDAHHGVGFSDSQMVSDSQMGGVACVKHDAQHGVGFSDSQMVSDSQILGWC